MTSAPIPEHSVLSPSKAAVWSVCTASIDYIKANEHLLPPEISSEAADEGTRAHAAASALLLDPDATPAFDNDDMAGYVGDYVDFVRDHITPGDEVLVERKVPLFYLPSQRGTMDVGIFSKDRMRITIIDLKYGAGTPVVARQNKQLAIYAESKIAEMEAIDEVPDNALVTLIIYQPRDRSDSNPVRLWAISRKELADFCAGITEAALTILQKGKTRFVAGEHCNKGFCRARGICKHHAAQGMEVIPEDQIDALPDANSLTREQRVRLVLARPAIEKWLEAVEDQEVAELLAGAPRMGVKLVEGKRGNREWTDEVEAEKLLRNHLKAEQVRPPGDVISPTKADKLLKGIELSSKFQNKLASLTTRSEGKPCLVPEDDKRPALVINKTEGLDVIAEPVPDCV